MKRNQKSITFEGEDYSNLVSKNGELFLKYIFDKYYLDFCKLSFKYVGRLDIAEDIVQNVFIHIWSKRFEINYSGSVKPYFTKSVVNASLNYLKSKFNQQHTSDEDKFKEKLTEFDQMDELAGQELHRLLKVAIGQLPDKCRAVFMLSRYSNLSYKEIAQELNISVKTVEAQIRIALQKIRQFLSKYGYVFLIILMKLLGF